MKSAGALLIALGGVFLLLLPVVGLLMLADLRRRAAIRRVPVSSCQQLRQSRRPSGAAAVAGRAGPGPNGVLRAPLSEEPCLWYRLVVRQRLEAKDQDEGEAMVRYEWQAVVDRQLGSHITLSDGTGVVVVEEALFHRDLIDQSSIMPVAVGTIDETTDFHPPAGYAAGSALQTLYQRGWFPNGLRGHDGFGSRHRPVQTSVAEWVIRPDTPMLVVGRQQRDPSGAVLLTNARGRICGATTRSRQEVLAELSTSIATSVTIFRAFPVVILVLAGLGFGLRWLGG